MSRETPLAGLRVLEVGSSLAGAFAGRWLAVLGARVTVLDLPGEPPPLAPPSEYRRRFLEAGKNRCVLEPSADARRDAIAERLADCDVLLDARERTPSGTPEAWEDLLDAENRELVVVATSAFGRAGPYAAMPGHSLLVSAVSGMLWHSCPLGRPPLAQTGSQPEYLGGLHALLAVFAGLHARAEGGRALRFDLSLQAAAAAMIGHFTARASQLRRQTGRIPQRALWDLYPTRDGHAGVSALPRNYPSLADAMDLPELRDASPFLDLHTGAGEAALRSMLYRWFAERSSADVFRLGHERRVPLSAVLSIGEVKASEQLAVREFFAADTGDSVGPPGAPAQLWRSEGVPDTGWVGASHEPSQAHPAAPSASGSELPLSGVRVLDLGQIWAGPYAARLLADLGADVVKVESPVAWDPNRAAARPPAGREAGWWNTGAYFQEYSVNKRSLGLDLRQPEGRELLGELVSRADIVIENFRADVLDKLGIGYDWMSARNPRVVLVSMSAFGKRGPEAMQPGYGPVIEQTSGIASLTRHPDGTPLLVGYAYGDPTSAVTAAAAAVCGLHARRRTGRGRHVDLAQRDVVAAMLGEAFVEVEDTGREPVPVGSARPGTAPHGVYPCAGDDAWVALAVTDTAEWRGLVEALGRPGWALDPALEDGAVRWSRRQEIDEAIAEWTAALDKREVARRCYEHGAPALPVWDDLELVRDPQLVHRRFHEQASHPVMEQWWITGWAARPVGAGPCVRSLAPEFGAHNAEVLRDWLGADAERTASLEKAGILASEPIGLPTLETTDSG